MDSREKAIRILIGEAFAFQSVHMRSATIRRSPGTCLRSVQRQIGCIPVHSQITKSRNFIGPQTKATMFETLRKTSITLLN